jgi:phosphate-selective porin OprO and OprP
VRSKLRSVVIVCSVLAAGDAVAQPIDPPTDPTAPPKDDPEPGPEPVAPTDPAPAPKIVADVKADDPRPGLGLTTKQVLPGQVPLELHPGGYVQVDGRTLADDTDQHDMTVRRLRFRLEGNATKYFRFRTLVDFAGSKLVVDDAWAEGVIAPWLAIRAGKDKSQFSIEALHSDSTLVFIERTYPSVISPNRDIGVWLRGDLVGGIVHYAAGIVDGVADSAVIESESDGKVEVNLHLLISPFAKTKQYGDLAVGAATTFGRTKGTAVATGLTNIKSAGQSSIDSFATNAMDPNLTALASGYRKRFTAQAYYFKGPIGGLAEYVRDIEPVLLMGSTTLADNEAWEVQASAAITPGDQPTYKGLKPVHDFDPEHGTYGAVELLGRYSELRLDSKAFDAKILDPKKSVSRAREWTVGANWYFNEFLKLQLDYTLTTFGAFGPVPDRPTEHVIATRFQAAI